jgi:hypothetical protein
LFVSRTSSFQKYFYSKAQLRVRCSLGAGPQAKVAETQSNRVPIYLWALQRLRCSHATDPFACTWRGRRPFLLLDRRKAVTSAHHIASPHTPRVPNARGYPFTWGFSEKWALQRAARSHGAHRTCWVRAPSTVPMDVPAETSHRIRPDAATNRA